MLLSRFLEDENSRENIEFWKACEDYKKIIKENDLKLKADEIYKEYIKLDSPSKISLTNEVKNYTLEMYNTTPLSVDIFERAKLEIESHLRNDVYPRFIESCLYKRFREQLLFINTTSTSTCNDSSCTLF